MKAEAKILYEARYRLKQSGFSFYIAAFFLILMGLAFIGLLCDLLCRLAGCAIFGMTFLEYTGKISFDTAQDMTYNISILIIRAICLLSVLFLFPIYTSVRRMAFVGARGKHIDARHIFSCFVSQERYIKSLRLSFNLFLRIMTWFILFMLPAIISFILFGYLENGIFAAIFIVFATGGLIGTTLASLRYVFADYLMFLGENSAEQAINRSTFIVKKNRHAVLKLFLRLLPFMLLTLLFFPSVFTVPYIEQSFAVCGKWLIKKDSISSS